MTRVGSKGSVKVVDRGMSRIEKNAPEIKGWGVKIGILASAPPPEGVVGDFNMASLASVHEYGSDNTPAPIPERSFIRSTVDEQRGEIERRMEAGARAVEQGQRPQVVLGLIGVWFQGEIQAKIVTGPFTPLAQSTIDAKGSSAPLIDTGRMRAAVSYEVVPPGGAKGAA